MYIDKFLDEIINKYNNAYYSTIKMKPVDVNSSTYIDCNTKNTNDDSSFKIGDHVRISNSKAFLENTIFQFG